MNRKMIYVVLVICLLVFGYFGVTTLLELYQRWAQENKWESMRDIFVSDMKSPIIVDEKDNSTVILDKEENSQTQESGQKNEYVEIIDYEVPNFEIDFNGLQATENRDIYAWIYIPDTRINYAILQHATDDAYYLEHNIDGTKGYPGCIYSEIINNKDFSDKNTVLYGHNMKNGTMFKGLHLYDNYNYMSNHPYVFVYTAEYIYVYKIFAAQQSDSKHQIKDYDTSTTKGWLSYVSKLVSNASNNYVYDRTTTIGTNSRILTMSTCTGDDNYRWLVHAILINVIDNKK